MFSRDFASYLHPYIYSITIYVVKIQTVYEKYNSDDFSNSKFLFNRQSAFFFFSLVIFDGKKT